MYGLGVISVHSGPKRSSCQCLSYMVASYFFSHAHAFDLQSLLPVQVSLCCFY